VSLIGSLGPNDSRKKQQHQEKLGKEKSIDYGFFIISVENLLAFVFTKEYKSKRKKI
jgi:hypothetical protein